MKPLNSIKVDIGQTDLKAIGGLNATQEFVGPFRPIFPIGGASQPRVIVTPNFASAWVRLNPGAAPVCIIEELTPDMQTGMFSGFRARATNMSQLGTAGADLSLNWLAISEDEGLPKSLPVNVRMGLTTPQFYVPQNTQGSDFWWQQSPVTFASPLIEKLRPLIAVLTAVDPFGSFRPQAAAVAGTVHFIRGTGFQMAGISTDSAKGSSAFNYLAAVHAESDQVDLVVDTGEVRFTDFVSDGPGQWTSLGVPFQRRFSEPPIVFVTAHQIGLPTSPPPVVPVVSNVTNDYFILSTRYSVGGGGFIQFANFFWIAIGCGLGCGQGPKILG